MKKFTIGEFKNYCETNSPNSFILDTENQEWYSIDDTMKMKLIFDNIKISFNPNIIMLTSNAGTISLKKVKAIFFQEKILIGDVFEIICGNLHNDDQNKSYKIVIG